MKTCVRYFEGLLGGVQEARLVTMHSDGAGGHFGGP